MKTTIYIFFFLTLILFSCQEDLNYERYDVIDPNTFPSTAADADKLVVGSYYPMNCNKYDGVFMCSLSGWTAIDISTDIGDQQPNAGSWLVYDLNTYTPSNVVVNFFTKYYNQISKMTLNIERVNSVDMDEDLKARYIAEIKCMRGWLAYFLYSLYGPIPVATLEELNSPLDKVVIERPTKEWMVDFIETNLTEAAEVLPYRYDADEDWGRATKGLANMVLLKLYMHEKNWSAAETMGRELTKAEYGFGLMDDYASIFTLENERNKEIVYAVPTTREIPQNFQSHVLPATFPTDNPAIEKWNAYRVSWKFYHTFEENDERLNSLIGEYVGTDGVTYNEENPSSWLWGGALPNKYGEDPEATSSFSQIDLIAYRYADVITLLAEAIANNNGTPTGEAIEFVNMVRRRAGLSDVNLADYGDLDSFNDMVLLERGHELWYENCRREDLIRHGKYTEYINEAKDVEIEDYKELFPIPQSIINEGQGVILQNPGY